MCSFKNFLWRKRTILLVMTVITVNVYTTHGQSYLLAIGQNPHVYFEREVIHHSPSGNNNLTSDTTSGKGSRDAIASNAPQDDQNSTIIVIKKLSKNSSDLSQTAMDVITIIWYVATFMALAAFFLLMACSDRRCNPRRRAQAARNIETPNAPPTPTPSYSEFAPPSYESVMKLQNIPGIYVIPLPMDEPQKENNTNDAGENATPNPIVTTFYSANEIQKLGR